MASSDPATIKKTLQHHFGAYLGDDVLQECIQLCKMYNVTGEDLFFTYESLVYGRGGARQVTPDNVAEIKQKLQRDLEKQKRQLAKSNRPMLPMRNLNGLMKSGGNADLLNRLGASSKIKVESPSIGIPSAGESSRPIYRNSSVQFTRLDAQRSSEQPQKYRYMYEKISERSEDDRIEDIAQILKNHYGIADFGDPAASTEEDVVVVGRITMDSESASAESAKLNEASLTLESSRMMGSGVRVPLKFDPDVRIRQAVRGTGGLGLFPGAIVALRGKNGGGGWFNATEILSLPPLPPRERPGPSKSEGGFNMHAACGPFTTDSDLQFKPWRAVVQKINADQPDVVLLLGPFLDCNHPSLKYGDIDAPLPVIFQQTFIEPLRDYLDSKPGALVLIVPSVRDLLNDHAVFPQAEFGSSLFNDPRIVLLPNPCRFAVNDVSFAVTSVDVLFHLRKEEFVKRATEVESIGPEGEEIAVDPMANLCRHILQKRSFYPLFPTPTDLAHEVNLDITHSDFLKIPEQPDVLIMPSRLRQFTKVIEGTVAANPSFATKGTYLSLSFSGDRPQSGVKVEAEISRLDA
ncbi:unnamed protein product [Somion occarium]|uniref:DNA polymerase alpha subunit B n=1 Tax=Somion occarium TaxID=3059160 RepID=A0ABP1DZU9_9APHY